MIATIDDQAIRQPRTRKLRMVLVIAAATVFVAGAAVVLRSGSNGSGAASTSASAQPVNAYATARAVGDVAALFKLGTGQPVPFTNGETLKVDGLDVTVSVSPYPPPRSATIDLGVELDGSAIENANVSLQYDMTTMSHGPFRLLAIPSGGGHYIAPVAFEMDGDFYLNVAVDTGQHEYILNLGVRAKR